MKKRYEWLANIINTHRFTIGAEVGVATGVTTIHLMLNCPELKLLYAVDNWEPVKGNRQWSRPDMRNIFHRKLKTYKNRLVLLEGLSWEQAKNVDNNSLDFVFIDASHDQKSVEWDIGAWIHKIKPSGMICGHDLHFTGVVKALQRMLPIYREAGVDNCWFLNMHDYMAYCNHG